MDFKIRNYIQNQIKELLESKYGYYKDKDGRIKQGNLADAWADRMDSALENPKEKKLNTLKNTLKSIKDEENIDESLTGEYEGKPTSITGKELKYILDSNLEISNSLEDFINKVTYQITDETSTLSSISISLLKDYYNQHSINEEEGSVETDDSNEAEKLAKKGVNVKLTKEDLLRQKLQETFKKKPIHEISRENVDHSQKLNESALFAVGYMASFAIVVIGFTLGTAALLENPGSIKAAIKFVINKFKRDKKSKEILQKVYNKNPELAKIKNPFTAENIKIVKSSWEELPKEEKDYLLGSTKEGVKDLTKDDSQDISLNEDDSFIPNHYDTTHIPKEIEAVLTQLGLTPLDRYIDYVNFMNTLPKSVKIVLTNGNDFDLYMEEFGLVLKADQTVDLSDDRNLALAKKMINQLLVGPIQVDDMEGEEIEDEEDISIEEPETEEEPTEEPEV